MSKLTEAGKAVKAKGEKITFFSDFKKFITKGNVIDLAVAVVIGGAFNAIVTGLVKNIITPVMTFCTSGVSINEWKYVLREAVPAVEADPAAGIEAVAAVEEIAITYGLWIQAIIDFFIIALCIFAAVRLIKSVERKLQAKEIAKAEEAAAAKKAEDDAKAAAAAEAAAKEAAAKEEFFANIKEQSALLREIKESLKK